MRGLVKLLAEALLSRQLQEEERGHVLINHIEHEDPITYHVDRCQVKL